MKSKVIVCAVVASTLGFSSLSFAQGWDRDGRGDRQGHGQRADRAARADHRDGRQDGRQFQQRQYQAPQFQQRHYQPQYSTQYRSPQWRGHDRQYWRGESLPYQFRQRQYYVNDWQSHRGLYAPPYGYQWVQSDSGDFLLVALATGLIANLLMNQY